LISLFTTNQGWKQGWKSRKAFEKVQEDAN